MMARGKSDLGAAVVPKEITRGHGWFPGAPTLQPAVVLDADRSSALCLF